MKKPLRCILGFHKWSKPKFQMSVHSNVKDYSKYCKLCGKRKTWVKARD